MTAARLVPAGVTLREQVDARWPDRDRASDGWIGDAAHQDRESDHNPDAQGWVHAIDLDEDLGEPGAMRHLADQLAEYCRTRQPGSERIKNLVYEDQVCSGTYADTFWTWRGSGYGHTHHLHVSFTDAAERDGSPFPLPILEDTMPTADEIAAAVWARPVTDPVIGDRVTFGHILVQRVNRNAADAAKPGEPLPPVQGGAVALTDADVERIAERTADLLAARLTS